MMTFPDTWEEFEKLYGFNDVEEIYTNNSRLIPSFRVKQWLDHLPSAQPQKGKWLKAGTRMGIPLFECSLCECAEEVPTVIGKPSYNFCPNCGCRMGEGDSDDA